jgi:parvulin-like peptidyl-prolyl isomerase
MVMACIGVGVVIGFLGGAMLVTAHSQSMTADYGQVLATAGQTTITRSRLAEFAIEATGKQLLVAELRKLAVVEEAARLNNVTVTPDEVQKRVQESLAFADNAQVKAQLESTPRALLESRLRAVLLEEKMMKFSVTERDAREFYTAHPNMFIHPARVKLICIACNTEEKAQQALRRLKDGEDPNAVSQEESDDKELRDNKGELGWFTKNQMSPEVADAIFGNARRQPLSAKQYTNVIPYVYDNVRPEDQHQQYLVFYVSEKVDAVTKRYEDAPEAALFYARANDYLRREPRWYVEREKEIIYKVRKNLFNDAAEMIAIPPTSKAAAQEAQPGIATPR